MDIKEAIIHARQVAEGCGVDGRDCAYQHDKLADWLEELQVYRTLGTVEELSALVNAQNEGQGKLPPCGKAVFVLTSAYWGAGNLKSSEIIECRVTTYRLTKSDEIKFSVNGYWKSGHPYKATFGATSIGKTVFLTRAEAEGALKSSILLRAPRGGAAGGWI